MFSFIDNIKNFVQNYNKIKLDNGIVLKLSKMHLTAKIIKSPEAKDEITIPNSIIHESKEYFIDSIDSDAFQKNRLITSIDFSQNSQIKMITSEFFIGSTIRHISFPSFLEKFIYKSDFFCKGIIFDFPSNSNCIKYVDSSHHLIISNYEENNISLGELTFSKKNGENKFDNLLHANPFSISNASIPATIKYIDDFCFYRCTFLSSLKFEEPSAVISFGNSIFSFTSISELTIPSHVEILKPDWCLDARALRTVFVSPENQHFKAFEGNSKLIVGRSNTTEKVYDHLVFACRDIESVVVPSSIKVIDPFAFAYCLNLNKIEFESNSNLNEIQKCAFRELPIESIRIPENVKIVEEYAFFRCKNLESIEFDKNCKIESFGENAFYHLPVEYIAFPSKLEKFDDGSINFCKRLRCIEFLSEKIVLNLTFKKGNYRIMLISFPNAHDVKINLDPRNFYYEKLIITIGNK